VNEFVGGLLYVALAFSYLGSLVFSPLYLVWAIRRSVRRRRIPPNPVDLMAPAARRALTVDEDVSFEALWGMVLALPALAVSLFALADPASVPFGIWLAILALLGIYAIAILAIARVTVSWWARWWPAVFAVVATPLAATLSASNGGVWLWGSLLLSSRLGIGYIADVVVGVRFARAVHSRDTFVACEADRAIAARDSSFVWPY